MIDLKGKVALVTGAASPNGIGFACARRLVERGAAVMLTDIDKRVEDRAVQLARTGDRTSSAIHDVTAQHDWDSVVAQTVDRFGGLDILVNNAGIAIAKVVLEMTADDWHRQININLTGVYYGCVAALKPIREQGRGGSLVNMSSISGLVGSPATVGYAASKGGVRLLTKSLALECAAEGIRVNSVHPGMIMSEIHERAREATPEMYDALMAAGIPMGHMGEPDDIAAMVAFLASDDAKYITGAEFVVDGGFTAR